MTETTTTKVVDEKTITTKITKTATDGVTETTVTESHDQKPKDVAPQFTSNLDYLMVNERDEAHFT